MLEINRVNFPPLNIYLLFFASGFVGAGGESLDCIRIKLDMWRYLSDVRNKARMVVWKAVIEAPASNVIVEDAAAESYNIISEHKRRKQTNSINQPNAKRRKST